MNKYILVFLFILSGLTIKAQKITDDNITKFEASNKYFVNGDFDRALAGYQTIEKEGVVSQGLYTNMGATYFKLHQLGYSLLYFEKGILIAPLDTELNFNKNKVLDKLDKTVNINNTTIDARQNNFLSIANYLNIVMVLIMLVSCALFFVFHKYPSWSNKLFNDAFFKYIFTVSFILILVSLAIVKNYQSKVFGINTSQVIKLNLGPSTYSKVVDSLNEGYKAEVLNKYDNWYEIKDAQGRTGWVNGNSFIEIK
jgi:tetratricopeptide (TPR) repeat protein